jgi:capsular polysaccharide biosynthesis protein
MLTVYENAFIFGRAGALMQKDNFEGRNIQRHDGTIAIITCNYVDIYYHWFFDLLPKIALLTEKKVKFDALYIPEPRYAFQRDTLKKIESQISIIFANEETILSAREAIVINPISPGLNPPDWVYEYIRSEFGAIDARAQSFKRIYISRRFAKNRRVINEDTLMPIFKEYGVETVFLENLSFLDQVTLFNSAEIVVAPHGSGLTNLVFSNKNTKVIELKGPLCAEECFAKLAYWAGNKYLEVNCPIRGYRSILHRIFSLIWPQNFYFWDFFVDPANLRQLIGRSVSHSD